MTIEEFIRARLDEDQAAANGAREDWGAEWQACGTWWLEGVQHYTVSDIARGELGHVAYAYEENVTHIARHDPARVLRQVAMLRAILHLHRSEETADKPPFLVCRHDQVAQMTGLYPCLTVQHIAAMWSDHPDYRQEWPNTPATA